MKKYGIIAVLILLIVIFFTLYKYRVQDLNDVLNIEQVDRILLTTEEIEINSVEIPRVSQEQINQLATFFSQYQVRLTMKEGWYSNHPREQFTIRIVYKNGDYEIYTLERDVVATTRIYEVVNTPLDYKWIQEFVHELNSN